MESDPTVLVAHAVNILGMILAFIVNKVKGTLRRETDIDIFTEDQVKMFNQKY